MASASEGEVEGYVGDFDAAAGTFRVAGYAVRLGPNVVYTDGVAADLKDGIRVEVKGSIQKRRAGGDQARIRVAGRRRRRHRRRGLGLVDRIRVQGHAPPAVSCGAGSGTFTVKGVTVSYDAGTEFRDGLSGATLDGPTVEVKCVSEVTASGTVYRATRIQLND